jgi:hypothetical protein
MNKRMNFDVPYAQSGSFNVKCKKPCAKQYVDIDLLYTTIITLEQHQSPSDIVLDALEDLLDMIYPTLISWSLCESEGSVATKVPMGDNVEQFIDTVCSFGFSFATTLIRSYWDALHDVRFINAEHIKKHLDWVDDGCFTWAPEKRDAIGCGFTCDCHWMVDKNAKLIEKYRNRKALYEDNKLTLRDLTSDDWLILRDFKIAENERTASKAAERARLQKLRDLMDGHG